MDWAIFYHENIYAMLPLAVKHNLNVEVKFSPHLDVSYLTDLSVQLLFPY